MLKSNGFLSVRVALVMGLVLICLLWAAAKNGEGQVPSVEGPEGLRKELRESQESLLPGSEYPLFFDAGEFVLTGRSDAALALAAALVPVAATDGRERWPVTLYEDPLTRETVFLNAEGREAFKLDPPPDYDALWLLRSRFPDGVPDGIDERLYDPAWVIMTAWLLPDEKRSEHQTDAEGDRYGTRADPVR